MHDNPRASEDEQEEAHEGRQQEEESMRYPEHDDPDEQRKRAHREPARRGLDGAGEGAEAAASPPPERESE